jgi:hypothetical protein
VKAARRAVLAISTARRDSCDAPSQSVHATLGAQSQTCSSLGIIFINRATWASRTFCCSGSSVGLVSLSEAMDAIISRIRSLSCSVSTSYLLQTFDLHDLAITADTAGLNVELPPFQDQRPEAVSCAVRAGRDPIGAFNHRLGAVGHV